MSYVKTAWIDDAPPAVSASNLNKMEQGIYDAHITADGAIQTPASKSDQDILYWDAATSTFKCKAVIGPRIVWGTVSSAGAKLTGSGFTVTRTGVGTYAVVYDAAFTHDPGVGLVVQAGGGAIRPIFRVSTHSTTGFNVVTYDNAAANAVTDIAFGFNAIGD